MRSEAEAANKPWGLERTGVLRNLASTSVSLSFESTGGSWDPSFLFGDTWDREACVHEGSTLQSRLFLAGVHMD